MLELVCETLIVSQSVSVVPVQVDREMIVPLIRDFACVRSGTSVIRNLENSL